MGIIGRHSFELCSRPRIISSASYVGDKEGKGPLRECFDKICRDDTLGLDSWEQAESRMFESAVRVALAKIKRQSDDLSCLCKFSQAVTQLLLIKIDLFTCLIQMCFMFRHGF